MATQINKYNEIAVDIEMNTDSYYPIVSTIQISTKEHEYVVDCLKFSIPLTQS